MQSARRGGKRLAVKFSEPGGDNSGRDNSSRDNSDRDNSGRDNSSRDNSGRDNSSRDNRSKENSDIPQLSSITRDLARVREGFYFCLTKDDIFILLPAADTKITLKDFFV